MRPLVLALFLLVACSGPYWGHLESTRPATFPDGQRIQVWRGGRPTVLLGVRLTRDSVLGRLDCSSDTAVVLGFARTEVDSLKEAHEPGVGGVFLGGMAGALGMLFLFLATWNAQGT